MKKLFIILGLVSSFQFFQEAKCASGFMGVPPMTEEERAGNKTMELQRVYCSFKEDPYLATVDEENFKELIKIIYQQSVDKLNIFLDDDKKKVVIDLEIKYQALHFVKKWIDKAPSTQWVEFEDVLSYAIAQGNKEIITRLLLEGLLYDERSISTTIQLIYNKKLRNDVQKMLEKSGLAKTISYKRFRFSSQEMITSSKREKKS